MHTQQIEVIITVFHSLFCWKWETFQKDLHEKSPFWSAAKAERITNYRVSVNFRFRNQQLYAVFFFPLPAVCKPKNKKKISMPN